MRPVKLFLSHSSRDRQFVAALARTLQRHGVQVWVSNEQLYGGSAWYSEVGKALHSCNWFLVVLTPHALKSDWVLDEVAFATTHGRHRRRYRKAIIPLLRKPCNYKRKFWTLAGVQVLDFTGRGPQRYRSLLKIWGLPYRPRG